MTTLDRPYFDKQPCLYNLPLNCESSLFTLVGKRRRRQLLVALRIDVRPAVGSFMQVELKGWAFYGGVWHYSKVSLSLL